MIICDLYGEAKECLQKEIEGKEYDICAACWKPLEQKLRGKGRVRKEAVNNQQSFWLANSGIKTVMVLATFLFSYSAFTVPRYDSTHRKTEQGI